MRSLTKGETEGGEEERERETATIVEAYRRRAVLRCSHTTSLNKGPSLKADRLENIVKGDGAPKVVLAG